MRLAALLAALVLAGCANPFAAPPPPTGPFDEDEPRPRPIPATPGELAACGAVSVEARPSVARVGEPVDIVATLANCGSTTLAIDRGQCPDEGSGFRLLIRRGLNDWHLHARAQAEGAALHDTPCVRGEPSVFGLPPNATYASFAHQVTFRWNGTFSSDPCWPHPSPAVPTCLQTAPAVPGEYVLRARIVGSGVAWEGNATLRIEGEMPAQAGECARLSLDVDGPRVVARVENCGGTDLTLDPARACNEPYPVLVRVANATMQQDGAAVRDIACYTRPASPIVVLAGTNATATFSWNGTVRDAGCEACRYEPLPPGEHAVEALLRPAEGGEWRANATIVRS